MTLLKLDRLVKLFGSLRAVDEVSLEINEGEIYGLLGPNGAGKTTTISMVAGLLKPDSGRVLVAGTDLAADPVRAKKVLGMVPQEIAVYEELTGQENLEFWGQLAGLSGAGARVRAKDLLAALSLSDRARDAVKTYSGGMKRRINISAGLMHRPRLLLLDEPTVGIDPQARVNILEFVRQLCAEGTAVLYTTHYLDEAETLCQRIGILDHGKLLAEGTLRELQDRLGGENLFVIEGELDASPADSWPGFSQNFRVLQRSPRQMLVAAVAARDPGQCLRDLLALPVAIRNVTLKRPNLNDLFLQLTGRDLRE